jgi:type IV secretory pathway TraG/TraD family ATPase VirD4
VSAADIVPSVPGEPRLQMLVNLAVVAFFVAGVLTYLIRRRAKPRSLSASPPLLLTSEWIYGWRLPPLSPEPSGFWQAAAVARWVFVLAGTLLCAAVFWVLCYHVPRPGFMLAAFLGFALLILFCASLPIALAVYVINRNSQGRRGDRTHGTAQWHSIRREWWNPPDAVAAALVMRPNTPAAAEGLVRYGIEDATFAHFTWEQLSRHMLLVGATGSGKTTCFYHHLMLSTRLPWIYQDQKGDLPLRDRFPDRPVWGLDTQHCRSRSGVWNPMEEVRGPGDVEAMAALLFPDKGDVNDWVVRTARMLFEAMCKCKRWRFDSIQQYVYMLEHVPLDQIIAELPAGYATTFADTRARGHYLGEVLNVLRPWINVSRISSVTYGRSTVTLDDFIRRGGYIVCNEDKHLRQPVTLFWGMLLHRLRNRPSDEAHPLLLLMDEFGDAGRIPNMAQALALYRSKGVGIIAGIQSLSLLESVYGAVEWKAIRDGFGTHVILTRHITPALQMELTQQLGTYTMEHPQGSVTIGGPFPRVSTTIGAPSRQATPLVPVDQWAYWSAHSAVIVRGGTGPTWWIPVSITLPVSPPGEKLLADSEQDWRLEERERIAVFGEGASVVLPAATAGALSSSAIPIEARVADRDSDA